MRLELGRVGPTAKAWTGERRRGEKRRMRVRVSEDPVKVCLCCLDL